MRLLGVALALAAFPLVAPPAPAQASYIALCSGYTGCRDAGYSNAGYASSSSHMYWRMYGGHNCTNYAAYRMVKAGMPDSRPWSGGGNAENWGHAMAYITDTTPTVGAVAWWDANVYPVGSSGHVAYVEKVVSSSEIWISDDNWGGDFHWHKVTKTGGGWPSGFIHFHDVALTNKKAPTVTGTVQVGNTLTATPGTWSSTPDAYTYQWFADGQAINGATASTLNLGPGKVGQQISVQVAASAQGYASAIATSAVTNEVAPGEIATVAEPVVSGEALVGSALTATRGSYDPGSTTKTVQWLSNGQPIAGATAWTLRLTPDQAGTVVRAVVSVSRAGYEPTTASSAPTPSVLGGTVQVTSPFTVSGTPRLGQPLEVVPGAVDPSDATASYQWLRDGAPIPGATGPTYVPVAADVGAHLSVRTDLSRQGYKPATQTTDPTTPVHTVPQLQVSALGKPGRAQITVTITAPGADGIRGTITVRVGTQTREVRVHDGQRTLTVLNLRPGTKAVVVKYLGKDLVDAGTFRGTVEIPR